jgi:dienelactone hydrolase
VVGGWTDGGLPRLSIGTPTSASQAPDACYAPRVRSPVSASSSASFRALAGSLALSLSFAAIGCNQAPPSAPAPPPAPAPAGVSSAAASPAVPATPAASATHPIRSAAVAYTGDGAALEGFEARPTDVTKGPAVLLFPDWMGVGENPKHRAEMLAKQGYVVLVADIYGKDAQPKDQPQAGALAGKFKEGDREPMRARAKAALTKLSADPAVDASKIVGIGYCFGGTAVLELARSGAPLAGVVSFHGGLGTARPAKAGDIKSRVLVLHGADDPYVKPDEVAAFENEMRQAKVDWSLVAYGGAVHAFTIPNGPDTKPGSGAAYDARADERSWAEFKRFLTDVGAGAR